MSAYPGGGTVVSAHVTECSISDVSRQTRDPKLSIEQIIKDYLNNFISPIGDQVKNKTSVLMAFTVQLFKMSHCPSSITLMQRNTQDFSI